MKMKIKDFKKPVSYNFGDIKLGTVFAIDGNFYMTVEPIEENEFGVPLNAANLETGELEHFLDTTVVQVVEAELHVR